MGINFELVRHEPPARPLAKGKRQKRPVYTVLDEVIDPDDLLPRLLDRVYTSGHNPTLDLIDPHGYVVFDEAQVRSLLAEIPRLAKVAAEGAEQRMVREVQRLGAACLATPGLQLRFIGD
ncbi:hypothetical protein ACFYY8_29420 [Streptosporangium sp. NPDC001559]|uniref:hypothetical protein n=1 Tax=Streptosporangium sp. NPDC001559 TaxID=3366187 RepID=UPI0036E8174E